MTPAPLSMIPGHDTRRKHHYPVRFCLVGAMALVLHGCDAAEPPPSAEDAAGAPVAEVDESLIEIDLDEYLVMMDPITPAGTVSISMVNRGFEEHNLIFVDVETDSTIWETDGRLNPGERRTVTITLNPGVYKVICDFSGHESRGMFAEFTARDESAPEDDP